jgi:hypothetical protein
MSVIAFHEKAGRGQVDSSLASLNKVLFLPPSGHCRHASIRTLEVRLVSLGACWAFSFQPVLPSDYRPVVLLLQTRTRGKRRTAEGAHLVGSGQRSAQIIFCNVFGSLETT